MFTLSLIVSYDTRKMLTNISTLIIATIVAYLFGSLSSAIIVCKIMRLPDPRTQGSQNPGATNVLRIGGKLPAAITLLGDVLKGFIPVLVAKYLNLEPLIIAFVTFAALIGHLLPIFFRFQGGKGVATAIGCLLALSLPTALCWIATWLLILLLFRYVSLASMIASALAPIYIWFFTNNFIYCILLILIASVLIFRHHSNIEKLFAGKENKLKS